MTKRKLNAVIALSLLVLYNICAGLSFSNCHSLAAKDFVYNSEAYTDSLLSYIEEISSDGRYKCENLKNLENCLAVSGLPMYPSFYGVFDKEGNAVFKNGAMVFSQQLGYVFVDMTDELIEQYENIKNKCGGYPRLYEMDYTVEEDKIVPIELHFSFDNSFVGTLVLNDKTPTKKLVETSDSLIEFYFNMGYEYNNVNKRIYNELKDKYLNGNVKNTTEEWELSDENGGGGYQGADEATYSLVFTFDNEEYYYFVVHTKHNLFYDTLISSAFKNSIVNQTILFSIVAVALFIVLNITYDKNKRLNQARQTFTSAAAHELKTPITIISNQCECLLEEVNPEKNNEYVSNIYRQNRHISALVNNLLQYNRIDSAKLEKTKFSLKSICLEELKKYELLIECKALSIDISRLSDVQISADEKLIRLVIDNYISNAVKYTPKGKAIVIACDKNKFSVYNEGSHIQKSDKYKIWEVFSRSTDNEAIESSGMGLAISKKILESHKLGYGFENTENGVEFYFQIKK